MNRRNRKKWFAVAVLAVIVAGAVAVGLWYKEALQPMPQGDAFYLRLDGKSSFDEVALQLEQRRVVRNALALKIYAVLQRKSRGIETGTFEFQPGMTPDETLRALQFPIEQQVRIPEGFWIARVAPILEKSQVCSAKDYIAAANDPNRFKGVVSFKLPEGSLEGYLYPDTYDLPPMLGADEVIKRQLKAFETKVWKPAMAEGVTPDQMREKIVIASMVELEAAVDEERPVIAGVIQNRIANGDKLQIDATVLYALQDWRQLQPGEVDKVESPYNTYLHEGLPPGPIGSPAWRSVSAAINPDKNSYLYYVARPNRHHYFSKTYQEHRRNINKAREEYSHGQDA